MGEKVRTIFRVMSDLNYPIMVKGQVDEHIFAEQVKENYLFIDDFLRSGVLGTTNKMKFILAHFGVNKSVVANLWNMKQIKESEKLSVNAIRIQETRLNKVFVEIFGLPELIENAFYSEDFDYLSEVCDKMRVLKLGDTTFDICFAQDMLSDFIKDGISYKDFDFTIADCGNELDFLTRISKQNILKTEESLNVDKNKLAFILTVLNQPMIKKNNTGVNKNKFDLVIQLNKNLVGATPIERTYETQKYLQDNSAVNEETDYQKMYFDLVEKYNELQATVKIQQESDFENTASLVSNLFSEDIAIPNAIMDMLNDIATDYQEDTVLHIDEAKAFSDTLFALSKYAMPIIGLDIANMNKKMLYCIWAALHNKLEIDGLSAEETTNTIEQFKEQIVQRVSALGDSDYINKVQKILNTVKLTNKED